MYIDEINQLDSNYYCRSLFRYRSISQNCSNILQFYHLRLRNIHSRIEFKRGSYTRDEIPWSSFSQSVCFFLFCFFLQIVYQSARTSARLISRQSLWMSIVEPRTVSRSESWIFEALDSRYGNARRPLRAIRRINSGVPRAWLSRF